ncbi:MAG: stage V sporulation protein AD [Firmicutes bacterium]|uniref:Stage V sporulation protein AD n=1 Tax=Candidatus Stercoripulliclostridium pullicola TaxID=2840953 RepID=A0A940ICD8_9FIRM|nr:stage V sporulation protein AD [Candidatus Stercoripulliclostridium pullicola]
MKNHTVFFKSGVFIEDTATIVGPKEAEGPLGKYFDKSVNDDLLGQKSHEKAEIRLHISAIRYLLNKTGHKDGDVDLCISGDLLDEIVGASLTMREFDIPFMGVYNACATFAESLILASSLIDGGSFDRIICSTSSHFCTAERQYRYPLELGNQRTPLSQWTATGVGATMLNRVKGKIRIDCATIGRVVDYGVRDANDMGACMAPAARETLLAHFEGSSRDVDYYDMILTGDLGEAGSGLLRLLMEEKGVRLGEKYRDCGVLLFNRAAQDVGQGGSGAACSSSVFNSYVYKKMMCGELKRVLLIPTGALCSKTSTLQGETVPGIAHAVSFTV